jgi:AraC-like DNA-binding protein
MVTAPAGHAHMMPGSFMAALGRQIGMPDWYLLGSGIDPGAVFPGMISVGQYLVIVGNILDNNHRADFVRAAIRGIGEFNLTGVALALQSAPTLGDALALVCRYGSDRTGIHRFSLQRANGMTCMTIIDNTDLGRCSAVLAETVVVAMEYLLSGYLRVSRENFGVGLRGTPEDHAPDLVQGMRGSITFGQSKNAVTVPSSAEAVVNNGHDAALWDIGVRRCEAESEQTRMEALARSVRGHVLKRLTGGMGVPRLTEIAALENTSGRTLIRKLHLIGSTYQELVDQVRGELAREMLGQGCTVSVTAEALGYADPSSFRRSYRRWYGINPSDHDIAART